MFNMQTTVFHYCQISLPKFCHFTVGQAAQGENVTILFQQKIERQWCYVLNLELVTKKLIY